MGKTTISVCHHFTALSIFEIFWHTLIVVFPVSSKFWFAFSLRQKLRISVTRFHSNFHSSKILTGVICIGLPCPGYCWKVCDIPVIFKSCETLHCIRKQSLRSERSGSISRGKFCWCHDPRETTAIREASKLIVPCGLQKRCKSNCKTFPFSLCLFAWSLKNLDSNSGLFTIAVILSLYSRHLILAAAIQLSRKRTLRPHWHALAPPSGELFCFVSNCVERYCTPEEGFHVQWPCQVMRSELREHNICWRWALRHIDRGCEADWNM